MKAQVTALLALVSLTAVFAAEPPSVDALTWMAGRWLGTSGESTIEEMWLPPSGSTMIGANRTVAGTSTVGFEYLRIVEDETGVTYLASPGGRQPPTAFRLIESTDLRAVFSNPDHDFPQRITYWREGDTLHARIEGLKNGEKKSAEWTWRQVTAD